MSPEHVGELKLRRFRAKELAVEERASVCGHTDTCGRCRARLRSLEEEQRSFESAVPFERFAAGVEAATRRPATVRRPRRPWLQPALALAAGVVVTLSVIPLVERPAPVNRTKGASEVVLQIAGPSGTPQRTILGEAPELLAPGERVRIGYQVAAPAYVASVSIDEAGLVSPLYPEAGSSLWVKGGDGAQFLPDSLEFTGRGAERVIVVVSDAPLRMESLAASAKAAFEKAGHNLSRLGPLDVPGQQFHRTLLKP